VNTDHFEQFQPAVEEEEVSDILAYLAARLHNARWTELVYMALEVHTIPAMWAEVVHLFCRLVNYNDFLSTKDFAIFPTKFYHSHIAYMT